MNGVSTETILVLGYAAFLVAVAGVLELVARHVHRRSERTAIAGFTYRPDLDIWECPDGRSLYREPTDTLLKVARYRAEAHHCNACAFKCHCTDSHTGRVIEDREDSWLESGLYRFHRGMSLGLLVLAAMILLLELFRNHDSAGELLLSVFILGVGTLGLRLLRAFRRPA